LTALPLEPVEAPVVAAPVLEPPVVAPVLVVGTTAVLEATRAPVDDAGATAVLDTAAVEGQPAGWKQSIEMYTT